MELAMHLKKEIHKTTHERNMGARFPLLQRKRCSYNYRLIDNLKRHFPCISMKQHFWEDLVTTVLVQVIETMFDLVLILFKNHWPVPWFGIFFYQF